MANELTIAYFATGVSVSGRFIFMYLLYTKKSTNPYSLVFSTMNIVSSSYFYYTFIIFFIISNDDFQLCGKRTHLSKKRNSTL